jgi:hypothetical protein
MRLALVSLLILISVHNTHAAVGKVTEQSGPTEIVRNKKSMESKVNSPVEMNDTIVTAKAKAKLTFEDNTTVNITEQSKIVIDDFVYDPKKGSGKLAMKMVMGTARYASGQIAKTNPQNVAVNTPTATVAVRGTDFSMTVDELGRSLIMLLPSCDKKTCVTGAISVKNEAGEVFMDQPFQTTIVTALNVMPSKPIIVSIDPNNINNMLIISPPKEVTDDEKTQSKTINPLDINFLDKDLLMFDELNKNYLAFDLIGLNYLDVNLLPNMLDESTKVLMASQEFLLEQATMLPGYSDGSGLKYGVTDDGKLVLFKIGANHTAFVTVNKESSLMLNISQDAVPLYQKVNSGGTTTINIIQRQ